jgi:uncharacterized membrane protein
MEPHIHFLLKDEAGEYKAHVAGIKLSLFLFVLSALVLVWSNLDTGTGFGLLMARTLSLIWVISCVCTLLFYYSLSRRSLRYAAKYLRRLTVVDDESLSKLLSSIDYRSDEADFFRKSLRSKIT